MLYLITYILNIFDVVATHFWVGRYGIDAELNPVGRWLIQNNAMWFAKIVVAGGCLYALYKFRNMFITKLCGWFVFGAYLLVCVWHIYLYVTWW